MTTETVDAFLSGPAPDELSALVRIEPFRRPDGIVDTGWSCREHAVVAAAVLCALGESAGVVHGANMFVQGPTSDGRTPVGLGNDERYLERGHAWAYVDDYGALDISPRLDERYTIDPNWRPLAARFGMVGPAWDVAGSAGTILMARTREEYLQSVAVATHIVDKPTAIYWEQSREPVHFAMLEDPGYINSPMTGKLVGFAGQQAHLKLATHIWGVARGERGPLGDVAARRLNKAWAKIRAIPDDTVDAFRQSLLEGMARSGIKESSPTK